MVRLLPNKIGFLTHVERFTQRVIYNERLSVRNDKTKVRNFGKGAFLKATNKTVRSHESNEKAEMTSSVCVGTSHEDRADQINKTKTKST